MALDFFAATNATIGINDVSLPLGGLFDICATWDPAGTCTNAQNGGHQLHRTGTSVDIDRLACRGLIPDDANPFAPCRTTTFTVARDTIRLLCADRKGVLLKEGPYHCEFLE